MGWLINVIHFIKKQSSHLLYIVIKFYVREQKKFCYNVLCLVLKTTPRKLRFKTNFKRNYAKIHLPDNMEKNCIHRRKKQYKTLNLILLCQVTVVNRDVLQKWAVTTSRLRTETGIGRRIITLGITPRLRH